MKKILIISMLVLTITSTVLAGTLSSYTTKIDDFAGGSVTGKEFIFLKDGEDTFQKNVKIAPNETVEWKFAVKDYDGTRITETNLYYKLDFNVFATPDKHAIDPLVVTVKDTQGNVINSVSGTGKISVSGYFPLSDSPQSKTYIVEIKWPSDDKKDINYAGGNFGTSINVSAAASQVPFEPPDNPNSKVTVLYETSPAWEEGAVWPNHGTYKYQFKISITNNSGEPINGWELTFNSNDDIYSYWQAKENNDGLPKNKYRFTNPDQYNIVINPGQTVEFGGLAVGKGNEKISNVAVNGSRVKVEANLNKLNT